MNLLKCKAFRLSHAKPCKRQNGLKSVCPGHATEICSDMVWYRLVTQTISMLLRISIVVLAAKFLEQIDVTNYAEDTLTSELAMFSEASQSICLVL